MAKSCKVLLGIRQKFATKIKQDKNVENMFDC